MAAPAWLNDAVLYQVYPQSFADSNGDARVLPHDRPALAAAAVVRHAGVKLDPSMVTAGSFPFGIFQL